MNVKKLNEIFGYALFIVGALRLLLLILALIQLASNISAVSNGGDVDTDKYTIFAGVLSLSQIILAIGSIIMIMVNMQKQSGVISGYLWGLGAILLELITSSGMLGMLSFFIAVSIYMKAGTKIINKNQEWRPQHKANKKMIKNTEWFYSEQKEQIKKENKIKERICKLKKLFDSDEIDEIEYDEEIYNEENNKRIFKKEYSNNIIDFFNYNNFVDIRDIHL